jgi:hypothetical protein
LALADNESGWTCTPVGVVVWGKRFDGGDERLGLHDSGSHRIATGTWRRRGIG